MTWRTVGTLEWAGQLLDLGFDLPDAPPPTLTGMTAEVAFSQADARLVALAFGVPLMLLDPARLAAEHRLSTTEPDRWADDGGAP